MRHAVIRSATINDLEALNELMFDLHDEHHCQSPDYFKTAEEIEQEKSIARYLDDPQCLVFIACEQDEVVGFISGHFCQLVSTVSQAVQMGSIDELYIVPSWRKERLASQLLQKVEQRFKECGAEEIFVEVWAFNHSAMSFYHHCGFESHIHWLRKSLKGEPVKE